MFFHHKELAFTVRVDNPDPVYARMLQQAIGGPEGEMRVMNQYLFQAWNFRGPAKYRDMLLSTGTEEIGHIEILATAVCMNLEGPKAKKVDDVVTNPMVAAKMGGMEPKHYLSTGGGATPGDADGVPFNAVCVDMAGNLRADMRANVAAEAVGRTLATRLYEMTDDPGMKEMWEFLIARDTMHQNQWMAVLEELGNEPAPGDFPDQGAGAPYAYQFFDHTDGSRDLEGRWTSGPSIDGIGEFTVASPAPALGQVPELQRVPHEMHRGPEQTLGKDGDSGGGLMSKVTEKLTP